MKRGVWLGIFCCLPVCVWLAGTLQTSTGLAIRADFASAVETVGWLQALALLAFTPSLSTEPKTGWQACALMVLIPLPLLVVAWLSGAVTVLAIANLLALLLAAAASAWVLARMVASIAARFLPTVRFEPALGLALLALALRFADSGILRV